jgi:hypothetical protein
VTAIANGVDSSTPTAMRPAESVASAAPMPPGTGIRLEGTDAAVLTKTRRRPDGHPHARHERGRGHSTADRRRDEPPPRVLVLTTLNLDEYVFGALRAGAAGFLLKDAPRERLLEAIHVVQGGEALLSPSITRRLIEDFAACTDLLEPPTALSSNSHPASERCWCSSRAGSRTARSQSGRNGSDRQEPRRQHPDEARPA